MPASGHDAFVIALLGIALALPTLALAPANAAGIRTDGTATTALPARRPGAPALDGGSGVDHRGDRDGLLEPRRDHDRPGALRGPADVRRARRADRPADLNLVPTPASGWEFTGWTGCPTAVADTCVLAISSLTSLTSPVANFLPTGDPTLPGACGSPVPLPGTDCSAPVTKITTSPAVTADKKTKEKTAAFGFKAYEADSSGNATATETTGATFECELVGPGHTAGFTSCTSPKSFDEPRGRRSTRSR